MEFPELSLIPVSASDYDSGQFSEFREVNRSEIPSDSRIVDSDYLESEGIGSGGRSQFCNVQHRGIGCVLIHRSFRYKMFVAAENVHHIVTYKINYKR